MQLKPRSGENAPVDSDPQETAEWREALDSVIRAAGEERARYLLDRLEAYARERGLLGSHQPYSAYRNSIPLERQAAHPGDVGLEERLTAIMRWNALAMVVRANQAHGELGGHIATYASVAEIFETGFHHFFRAPGPGSGDLVFFQPHSAPGVYARAFLEGRLTEEQIAHYRREADGHGLCSYPHPWLMPDFWQFPTGSMGIGPISAIYQARFMRYLQHRGLSQTEGRHVWGIFGDGEMDEPESIAALTLAARERLDNLTFIVNCNLQRLDGPVRGNGQIIQELEGLFAGAGWNVIKVLWSSDWDPLFARDTQHVLLRRLANTVDGQYQTLGANDGKYNQDHFFKLEPELQALVAHMSAIEIDALRRGGHDPRKLYAAFAAAKAHKDQPTVILAKTKKGYSMGRSGDSRMTAHQQKKLEPSELLAIRDRLNVPLNDDDAVALKFYRPPEHSAEMRYLREQRAALGGASPRRQAASAPALSVPPLSQYGLFALQADGKEMSTTMAFVRLLTQLLRDKALGPKIVPIVADEARTFGMAALFKQLGIYAPDGQQYEPEDAGSLMAYREARDGQLLEEGISEAGALSSWVAAATSYSTHGLPLLPFYIFYSMFGFQRVGDLIWAAADQRSRGFLLGATAGRTTLGGEGLQHQDGSSQVMAGLVPNCRAYDPAFAYELAVILDHGARAMLCEGRDEFYYLTVTNESYPQPSMPASIEGSIVGGLYRLPAPRASTASPQVRLLGSGAILREVIAASELLAQDWQIESEVWSVPSFSEITREAREELRRERLGLPAANASSLLRRCLAGATPVVAATDYVSGYGAAIAEFIEAPVTSLGTDGFGRSDTRETLRRFFEVDRFHIVVATLHALGVDTEQAVARYGLVVADLPPWRR